MTLCNVKGIAVQLAELSPYPPSFSSLLFWFYSTFAEWFNLTTHIYYIYIFTRIPAAADILIQQAKSLPIKM